MLNCHLISKCHRIDNENKVSSKQFIAHWTDADANLQTFKITIDCMNKVGFNG